MRGLLAFLLFSSLNAHAFQALTREINGDVVILTTNECVQGGYGYKYRAYYRGKMTTGFCWVKDKDKLLVVSDKGDSKIYDVSSFEKLE